MKSKDVGKHREQQSSKFSALLEQSMQEKAKLSPGSPVSVTVSDVSDREFIMVKTDQGTGMIERGQLTDANGDLEVARGQKLQAFFVGEQHGDLVFTVEPSGPARAAVLEHADTAGVPLRGKVVRRVKGGFEIEMGDARAFCPASQLESSEDPIGSYLQFLIIERDARRLVVSHRGYRDRLREEQRGVLQESLSEGDIVTGTVRSVQNFGAFVDLNGIEGLIPVSELAFRRVDHPKDVVSNGQEVRVKVIRLDWKENRITLSLKALMENPWQGKLPFKEGDIVEGEVESVKNFGIFVRLPDHFTGLVPNAESGHPRGARLEQEFPSGQKIRVMVRSIDRSSERIGLSVKAVADADTRAEYEDYMKQQQPEEPKISSFGQQLLASLEDDKSKRP